MGERYVVRVSNFHLYRGERFANECAKGSIGRITGVRTTDKHVHVQWVSHPKGSELEEGNTSNIDWECVQHFPTFHTIQDVEHFLNTTPQREG